MFNEYREKALVMLHAMKSVRAHVGQVVRPKATEMAGPRDFIPELQSTSFAANGVFAKIPEEYKCGLSFKTAALKPRNPRNGATEVEEDIIKLLDSMKASGKEPVWEGVRKIDGLDYFLIAVGEENQKGCMKCHSTPENAPKAMVDRYPISGDRGYGRIEGRIESAEIVSIPMSSIDVGINKLRTGIIIGFVAALGLLLAAVTFGLKLVFTPLGKVTDAAQQVADGNLATASASLESMREGAGVPEPSKAVEDELVRLVGAVRKMIRNLNGLIGQVQQSGIQVTTSATEIAASAGMIEATVTQQAVSLNEISATSRDISHTSKDLVETMSGVTEAVHQAATLAGEGQNNLASVASTMQRLMDATRSISARLSLINEEATGIGSIVSTISKVSDRTNLLSLNAAIESEKAGEFGLGFSVVAREIRRLADQTAVATLVIEKMVGEMQSAVSSGVMEVDRFIDEIRRGVQEVGSISEQLSRIIEQVESVGPQFETVYEGMMAQSTGAEQISQAMTHLSEAADQTKESLHEFHLATLQLNETVQDLRVEVSKFKVRGRGSR
jgi:methyl-accepting chemotaxis protein